MPSVIRGDDNFDTATGLPIGNEGTVGTYAYLNRTTENVGVTAGTTYAGSDLAYAGHLNAGSGGVSAWSQVDGSTVSGTWRAMGTCAGTFYTSYYPATVFLRIS